MRDFRLYVILDNALTKKILKTAEDTLSAGADVIQFRFEGLTTKKAIDISKKLRSVAHKSKALFIVNNRLDIALASDADGVHLGQEDLPVSIARGIIGKQKIIGLSCHNRKEIISANRESVDYISIGPIFKTKTKPQYKPVGIGLLRQLDKINKINPVVVIGGIKISNLRRIIQSGIKRVAVCSAIIKSRDIYKTTNKFKKLVESPSA